MKKSQKILIGAVLVIGLLLILPFLIPVQTYLHQAEKIASEKLGQPVTIGSAHVLLLPSPRVVASDLAVGAHQELKVANLVVVPTISTLFSDAKILDLSINKPVVKKAALDFVAALKAPDDSTIADSKPSSVNIRHIKIDELQLIWPNAQLADIKLPIINAEAMLTKENKLESALIKTMDGKLGAAITPSGINGNDQLIMVNASQWTLPAGLPLLIDKANLEMYLKGNRLTIPNIDIALYDGKLTGDAVISWPVSKGKVN